MADEAEFFSGTDAKTALVFIHGVGVRPFQYVDIDGRARVEGCIDLGSVAEVEGDTEKLRQNPQAAAKGQIDVLGVAIREIRFRWKEKTIPFTIDPGLPNQQRVRDAIAHWHQKTAIRLVERTNQNDFVTFRPGGGCASAVGRQGGRQFVTLGPDCTTGNCIHEIGRVVRTATSLSVSASRILHPGWSTIFSAMFRMESTSAITTMPLSCTTRGRPFPRTASRPLSRRGNTPSGNAPA